MMKLYAPFIREATLRVTMTLRSEGHGGDPSPKLQGGQPIGREYAIPNQSVTAVAPGSWAYARRGQHNEEDLSRAVVAHSNTNGKADHGHGHGPRAQQEGCAPRCLERAPTVSQRTLCAPEPCIARPNEILL